MQESRFGESQIVGILIEADAGAPIADLLWKHGLNKPKLFKGRSKYADTSIADVKRLRDLEAENAKLKLMYAELARENAATRDVLAREL
jgi:putative transposase